MKSPIQKILENLEKEVNRHENNKAVSVIFSAFIDYLKEEDLLKKEEIALNQAFNDGRFYKPHIQNQIKNYYKEKYNGKEN
jgi:hypothetical protein